MSVSSISTTPASPPPSYTDSSESSSSQPADLQRLQRPESKPNEKDGDEVAAAQQQSARAPLPPGQGTRVDVLA
jgi:hypothetical protein